MPEIIQKALATIEEADNAEKPHGGFTAVLSTPSQDRDGDQLARDEWLEPLPDRIPIDIDHEMNVRGTVGSARPYFDDLGRMMIDVDFASTPQAQEVRTLVKEGHIGAVSVAFLTDKSKKDGVPRRELLNAGIVAIPSNRDAVIFAAKSVALPEVVKFPRDAIVIGKAVSGSLEDLRDRISGALDKLCPADSYPWTRATFLNDDGSGTVVYEVDGETVARDFSDDGVTVTLENDVRPVELTTVIQPKSVAAEVITKASQAETSLVQGIHDAACHLGAACAGATEPAPDPDDGSDDGANKSTKPNTITIDVKPRLDLDEFKAQIDALTNLKTSAAEADSPQDDDSAPANAASEAASDEEPAEEPADAAVDESDELAQKMLTELLISSIDLTELDS